MFIPVFDIRVFYSSSVQKSRITLILMLDLVQLVYPDLRLSMLVKPRRGGKAKVGKNVNNSNKSTFAAMTKLCMITALLMLNWKYVC